MPPSRRQNVSADIRGTSESSALAQLARWAAWLSMYSWSSAIFWWATRRSRWATARICVRSIEGQARMATAVWGARRSRGSGSMQDSKRELAIQRSGMAGLDGTWCSCDAPRASASRKQRDRLAGVRRRAAEIVGVASSSDDIDSDEPTGKVAVWGSSSGEVSIMLSSEEASQLLTEARIVFHKEPVGDSDSWLEGTGRSSKKQLKLFHSRHEKPPERCEVWAFRHGEGVVQLLAGAARQSKVHPQWLCGWFALIKKGPATKPLQAKLSKTLIESVSAALAKPVYLLYMVFPI